MVPFGEISNDVEDGWDYSTARSRLLRSRSLAGDLVYRLGQALHVAGCNASNRYSAIFGCVYRMLCLVSAMPKKNPNRIHLFCQFIHLLGFEPRVREHTDLEHSGQHQALAPFL